KLVFSMPEEMPLMARAWPRSNCVIQPERSSRLTGVKTAMRNAGEEVEGRRPKKITHLRAIFIRYGAARDDFLAGAGCRVCAASGASCFFGGPTSPTWNWAGRELSLCASPRMEPGVSFGLA